MEQTLITFLTDMPGHARACVCQKDVPTPMGWPVTMQLYGAALWFPESHRDIQTSN